MWMVSTEIIVVLQRFCRAGATVEFSRVTREKNYFTTKAPILKIASDIKQYRAVLPR